MITQAKPRFKAAVAAELTERLGPFCECLAIAGSLRRRKPEVGDLELLFIPKMIIDQIDMFAAEEVAATDSVLFELLNRHILEHRLNKIGVAMWGPRNKLGRHIASGLPVDLFTATKENWYSLLVCRTGPAELNIRICQAFQRQGLIWRPYEGVARSDGSIWHPESEEALFKAAGIAYKPPWERTA